MTSWLSRLLNSVRADKLGGDIDREIAFHLAQREDALVASGMSRRDAGHEARRMFGNVSKQKELTRERDLLAWAESTLADVRYALRGLGKARTFALVTILSLALGIGANTAIFTLVNVVLLRSIPVSHPEQLVEVTIEGGVESKGGSSFSREMWEYVRDHQHAFAGVLAYTSTGGGDLSTGGEARPIPVGLVSGSFFSLLGVQPAAGRVLIDADDRAGCAGAVVLSHAFWQREFGSDPAIVGKPIRINGHPFDVVGVARRGFIGLAFGYYPPVWMPQCAGVIVRGRNFQGGGAIIARLRDDVPAQAARAQLAAMTAALVDATVPADVIASNNTEALARHKRTTLGVAPFRRGFPGLQERYGEGLLVLMAIVGVVLLIACANTANLLLARATARRREFAVRLALGASRTRLIRQLLTESVLLSGAGAALGLLFAAWGTRMLVSWLSSRNRPMLTELTPDANVLLFTIGAAATTAMIFGLAPAWRAVRIDAQTAMLPGERGVAEGGSRFGLGKALVVAQLALSLAMITGAGLLVGSWRHLATMDPGFRASGVLVVGVNTRASGIPAAQRAVVFGEILERLRGLPGVVSAASSLRTPIGNTEMSTSVTVHGTEAVPGAKLVAYINGVSEKYFATTGTRILRGRDFATSDVPSSPGVAVVNETAARRLFGPGSVVGTRFVLGWTPKEFEVVGVVEDAKDQSLAEASVPQVYITTNQDNEADTYANFLVQTNTPAALAQPVGDAILAFNKSFSLNTRTLKHQVDDSVRLPRTLGMLSGFFGSLALLLASIGLYGIMSYGVARRRNEIGVRVALGATQSRIVRMIVDDVARLVALGIAGGLVLSFAATRALSAFLVGVTPTDPATFALSALALVVVAVFAALAPARRAATLDPVSSLREE